MKRIKKLINKKIIIRAVIFKIAIFLIALATSTIIAKVAYGITIDIKQVKTTDSPVVYYLDHALAKKKAYVNETSYLAYGNKWDDIQIISQDELNQFADVNLVKLDSSPAVFYIKANKKTLIKSEADFIDFGFDWDDIMTVNQIDLDQYQLTDYNEIGLVKISDEEIIIKSDLLNLKDNFLAVNTKDNLAAVFNFKAKNGIAKIKNITFTLKGIFNSETVDKIYITDENDEILGASVSIRERKASFYFGNNVLFVRSDKEEKIKVFVNFTDCPECLNNSFQITVDKLSDIGSDAKITGNFPVKAEIFKLIYASNILADIFVEENSINYSGQEAAIDSSSQILGKFTVQETSGREDVLIKELSFKNKGTARELDLVNFKLKNENNKIIARASQMNNGIIIFQPKYCRIKSSNSETFTVLADIADGEDRTINLELDYIKAVGVDYGFGLKESSISLDEAKIIVRNKIKYLHIIARDLKNNNQVFSEQTGTIIGNFQIRNNSERRISLESLNFSLEKSGHAPNLDKTVYAVNYETGEVLDSFVGNEFTNGSAGVGLNIELKKPKNNIIIALITDIPNQAKNGDYYQVVLNKINYETKDEECYTDDVDAPGVKLMIYKYNVSVQPNYEIDELSYIKGQKNIKIASFIIEAGAGDDVIINNIIFTKGSEDGVISYANGFSNIKAYVDTKRSGNIITQPLSGSYTFTDFNYKLKAGSQAEIKVFVDTKKNLEVDQISLVVSGLAVTGYNSGMSATISGLEVESNLATFGEVKAEINAMSGGEVISGEAENLIASFMIKNTGAEELKLKDMVITANDGFLYSFDYSNLKIVRRDNNQRIGYIVNPDTGANKIGLGNQIISSIDSEMAFDVYVDASVDVRTGSFEIYFSELYAEGLSTYLEADISGDPTESVTVMVN